MFKSLSRISFFLISHSRPVLCANLEGNTLVDGGTTDRCTGQVAKLRYNVGILSTWFICHALVDGSIGSGSLYTLLVSHAGAEVKDIVSLDLAVQVGDIVGHGGAVRPDSIFELHRLGH